MFALSICSVSCDDNDNVTRQLSWKPGTLKNVVSPFNMGSVISSAAFPEGLNPENYGVFVCSSPEGYTTENFILDGKPNHGTQSKVGCVEYRSSLNLTFVSQL